MQYEVLVDSEELDNDGLLLVLRRNYLVALAKFTKFPTAKNDKRVYNALQEYVDVLIKIVYTYIYDDEIHYQEAAKIITGIIKTEDETRNHVFKKLLPSHSFSALTTEQLVEINSGIEDLLYPISETEAMQDIDPDYNMALQQRLFNMCSGLLAGDMSYYHSLVEETPIAKSIKASKRAGMEAIKLVGVAAAVYAGTKFANRR